MRQTISFALFLAVWNRAQGQGTPRVHLRIAHWLAARRAERDARLLLMAFRSCGKSTIVGLFAAWLLSQQPDLRILVLAADANLAAKMVRNTRRIIERHPLTRALRPDRPDQWAADRFTVRRTAEWRDPSMIAFGIGANITGSRADVVLCDDVEVPNTCDTPDKRDDLRARLAELSFVLVPGGMQLYIGTPHTDRTIYDVAEGGFLEGAQDLRIPLVDAQGQSAWPERFSDADIARIRRASGPRRFAAQMLLQAQPIADARLNPDCLRWYDGSPPQGASLRIWWDPAFGLHDGSVVAAVYADAQGEYWLHRLEYLRIDARAPEDEATQQCRAVAALCRDLNARAVCVEINGIGRFLPGVLRRVLAGSAGVVEISSHRPKDLRIAEGFDAVLAARALHVHRTVAQTPFVEEMRGWKPGGKGRDDGLDAVAGALSQHAVRSGAAAVQRRIKTDFNVME